MFLKCFSICAVIRVLKVDFFIVGCPLLKTKLSKKPLYLVSVVARQQNAVPAEFFFLDPEHFKLFNLKD